MLWSLPSCPPSSGITLPHHSDLPLVPKTHLVSFHFMALQLANLLCQNAVPMQPPLPALGSFPLTLWIVALKVQFSKRQSLECMEDLPTCLQHYHHLCLYVFICQVTSPALVSSTHSCWETSICSPMCLQHLRRGHNG